MKRRLLRSCKVSFCQAPPLPAGSSRPALQGYALASLPRPLPGTIVYSYVGGMLTGGAQLFVTALMILFALSALIVMMRKIYMEKQARKQEGK